MTFIARAHGRSIPASLTCCCVQYSLNRNDFRLGHLAGHNSHADVPLAQAPSALARMLLESNKLMHCTYHLEFCPSAQLGCLGCFSSPGPCLWRACVAKLTTREGLRARACNVCYKGVGSHAGPFYEERVRMHDQRHCNTG